MTEHASDRWLSAGLSILVHAVLVALVGFGWWSFHARSHPLPVLAIDATVVDSKVLAGSGRSRPPPAPAPVAPPPRPPPVADNPTVTPPPDEAQRAQERAGAQEEQQRQAREDAQRRVDAERAAAEQKAQQESERRAQEQAERQAREDAQRKAHEEAERKAREEAKQREEQRLAEAKRQAEEKRKQQEAQQLAQNEADLRKGIDADEHALEARSSAAMANYQALIRAKIERAWFKPPTAREGLDCTLDVTQVPGGQVVNVKLGACNGDAAVKQSIIDAAYRASPLPAPSDPALFERQLEITFRPTD